MSSAIPAAAHLGLAPSHPTHLTPPRPSHTTPETHVPAGNSTAPGTKLTPRLVFLNTCPVQHSTPQLMVLWHAPCFPRPAPLRACRFWGRRGGRPAPVGIAAAPGPALIAFAPPICLGQTNGTPSFPRDVPRIPFQFSPKWRATPYFFRIPIYSPLLPTPHLDFLGCPPAFPPSIWWLYSSKRLLRPGKFSLENLPWRRCSIFVT